MQPINGSKLGDSFYFIKPEQAQAPVFTFLDAHHNLKPWIEVFIKGCSPYEQYMGCDYLYIDPFTSVNHDDYKIQSLEWEVRPDFDNKQLVGCAKYSIERKRLDPRSMPILHFDCTDLIIHSVTVSEWAAQIRMVPSTDPQQPGRLSISMGTGFRSGDVKIRYSTKQDSPSIVWVEQGQNTDPLVYTNFIGKHGAAVIPGPHSRQFRLPVTIKAGSCDTTHLLPLHTACMTSGSQNAPVAQPLYSLGIVWGNFMYQSFPEDPRTGVYAEPEDMYAVHSACELLPKMLQAAEELCGPYRWGKYYPIFSKWPKEGMVMQHAFIPSPCPCKNGVVELKNPYFAVHELAHAFAGNHITNDIRQQYFWNEGFACFLECKIIEKVGGTAYVQKMQMEMVEKMKRELGQPLKIGEDSPYLFSSQCRGMLFFCMLEKEMGPELFGRFLQDFVEVLYHVRMCNDYFWKFLQEWMKNESPESNFDLFVIRTDLVKWLYELFEMPKGYDQLLRNLIPSAAAAPGVAADNPLNGHPSTTEKTVPLERLGSKV